MRLTVRGLKSPNGDPSADFRKEATKVVGIVTLPKDGQPTAKACGGQRQPTGFLMTEEVIGLGRIVFNDAKDLPRRIDGG